MSTRRQFIAGSACTAAASIASTPSATETSARSCPTDVVTLCGEWLFRPDPNNIGVREHWFRLDHADVAWHTVIVPHTWQVEPAFADYRGVAWYLRSYDVPKKWQGCAVRVEFEAVFHSAQVWVNGQSVGEHNRKGYTAFTLDITHAVQSGRTNTITVRVDNAFNQDMLPRGRSSDWANDGGIFRPVHLLATPPTFVERVDVDATPDLATGDGTITITAYIRNADTAPSRSKVWFRTGEEGSSLATLTHFPNEIVSIKAQSVGRVSYQATLPKARLWHFDAPNLYWLEFSISGNNDAHQLMTSFGVRKFEIRDGGFHLNGEPVRLMGVERMAGSNPDLGMAESTEWIIHEHADMKNLNCVFTRVHWPQDKRVLEYCDRHGILMQTEVPAWGTDTFTDMTSQLQATLMQNGLEQLGEMIARDRNHPCVIAWGLCNEINGQNPPAYAFAKRMLEEAKHLDPTRLCSYASNSLASTPQRDVADLMDFIETNEYYGTWAPGTAEDAARHFDDLHTAFPSKPIVVSEYGYCACTPDRPEGDENRIEILRSHQNAIRSRDFIAGAIFFCYNDYRTHIGDRGVGPLQQRVHGVVDLYGTHKPSYELLRRESSPIELLVVQPRGTKLELHLKARNDFPMYTLKSYTLRGRLFGPGNIPIEQQDVRLPDLAPGCETRAEFSFTQSEAPLFLQIEVLRPTSFSVRSLEWRA